ncbi:hypothetical protein EVAR_84460_1 [Eumeta japonica]|uniref:Uncharacterized protein n=1 Tax=Eumeta variegata TaxID=151549 RepID=A0A4C1XA74_EUMVA|nr:hypothetical protein EVAR_84460_1 [Eumeta japonica]
MARTRNEERRREKEIERDRERWRREREREESVHSRSALKKVISKIKHNMPKRNFLILRNFVTTGSSDDTTYLLPFIDAFAHQLHADDREIASRVARHPQLYFNYRPA